MSEIAKTKRKKHNLLHVRHLTNVPSRNVAVEISCSIEHITVCEAWVCVRAQKKTEQRQEQTYNMVVTLETSHPEMSPLKSPALLNISLCAKHDVSEIAKTKRKKHNLLHVRHLTNVPSIKVAVETGCITEHSTVCEA